LADLKRRLSIVERAMRLFHPGIERLILINDPDGLSEDDATAGENTYHRLPGETVEAFRLRASADAESRRISTIFFGHGPASEGELTS
jgi:hypothetical protein